MQEDLFLYLLLLFPGQLFTLVYVPLVNYVQFSKTVVYKKTKDRAQHS